MFEDAECSKCGIGIMLNSMCSYFYYVAVLVNRCTRGTNSLLITTTTMIVFLGNNN